MIELEKTKTDMNITIDRCYDSMYNLGLRHAIELIRHGIKNDIPIEKVINMIEEQQAKI